MDMNNIEKDYSILKNPKRPNARKYIESIFYNFIELSGDRLSGNDSSITGGVAFLEDVPVTIIGQLRGNTIDEQIRYNFSMTRPEGFRMAIRLMTQAEKFGRPVICFVDTIGADPSLQSEKNGQVFAIANTISTMLTLKVPTISILIGNGCSGGAVALCVADKLIALDNSALSVISPKAYAEICWKDSTHEIEAVQALKMGAKYLYDQGIVDILIPEPIGGAHIDPNYVARQIKNKLVKEVKILQKIGYKNLNRNRQAKYEKLLVKNDK